MWVTCYADASYSRVDGGAWAVWMRGGAERLVRSGACPPYVRDSTAAELAALYAGAFLATQRWGARVRVIAFRSDCSGALELTDPQRPLSQNAACRRLQEKLRELVATHGLELHCRWVRGHQPIARGTAAFLNARCDALARKSRRATGRSGRGPVDEMIKPQRTKHGEA